MSSSRAAKRPRPGAGPCGPAGELRTLSREAAHAQTTGGGGGARTPSTRRHPSTQPTAAARIAVLVGRRLHPRHQFNPRRPAISPHVGPGAAPRRHPHQPQCPHGTPADSLQPPPRERPRSRSDEYPAAQTPRRSGTHWAMVVSFAHLEAPSATRPLPSGHAALYVQTPRCAVARRRCVDGSGARPQPPPAARRPAPGALGHVPERSMGPCSFHTGDPTSPPAARVPERVPTPCASTSRPTRATRIHSPAFP